MDKLLLSAISQSDCFFCLNELVFIEAYKSNLYKNECIFLLKLPCLNE